MEVCESVGEGSKLYDMADADREASGRRVPHAGTGVAGLSRERCCSAISGRGGGTGDIVIRTSAQTQSH